MIIILNINTVQHPEILISGGNFMDGNLKRHGNPTWAQCTKTNLKIKKRLTVPYKTPRGYDQLGCRRCLPLNYLRFAHGKPPRLPPKPTPSRTTFQSMHLLGYSSQLQCHQQHLRIWEDPVNCWEVMWFLFQVRRVTFFLITWPFLLRGFIFYIPTSPLRL